MTRLEKQTIEAALYEYAKNHDKKGGENNDAAERARANTARAILSYWHDVVNASCGEVKI